MTPKERSKFKQSLKKKTREQLQNMYNNHANPSEQLLKAEREDELEKSRIVFTQLDKFNQKQLS